MPSESDIIASLRAQLDAQEQIIILLKWAVGGLATSVVAVSGFMVAWVRSLYDSRTETQEEQITKRDALLERVLTAVAILAEVKKSERGGA